MGKKNKVKITEIRKNDDIGFWLINLLNQGEEIEMNEDKYFVIRMDILKIFITELNKLDKVYSYEKQK